MKIWLLCFLLPLFGATNEALAQATARDSLSWSVTSFVDVKGSSATISSASEFRTYGSSIDWLQEGGAQIYTYHVESVDGTWADVAQDGEITFHVSWNALTGTLNFKRDNGVMSITMNFDKSGSTIMSMVFNVTSINQIK